MEESFTMENNSFEQRLLGFFKKAKLEDEATTSLKIQDGLEREDLSRLVPVAISEIVKEAAEPLLITNQLFTTINQKEGIYIQLPAEGAMEMVDEIAPGAEYPVEEITVGGGNEIRIDIRKFGIKLNLTEEMVDQSQWDVIGQWLKQAGRAFARRKNRYAFAMMNKTSMTLVDNANPSASVLGRALSGKAYDGSLNGSFASEDFFDIYAAMLQEGFAPNLIVMHPLSWAIWAKDPFLKVFAWTNGGGPLMGGYDVQGVKRDEFFNSLGMSSGGARPGEHMPPDFKGMPILPSYLQIPFKVLVSPQVPYNPVTKLTDIYFIDNQNAGAFINAEGINHYQWNDPERDIHSIKLREKYALAILNEGRGVGVVKNVKVTPNRIADFGVTNVNVNASELAGKLPETMGSAPISAAILNSASAYQTGL
jgi:hypothetical protein